MNRGRIRLYIGAAAGVGTTYAMLDEAIRRSSRGTTVAVGWVNTHLRPNTQAMLKNLLGENHSPEFLNINDLVSRQPQVVLIDELTHESNGVPHWQHVEQLLDNGIDVIATLTVQQIASLADHVEEILGTAPVATVPDRFLQSAEQIEMVDITPEAIRRRIAHGNVFAPTELAASDADLFNSESFARLRALLLRWMSEYVDAQLTLSGKSEDRTLVLMNHAESSQDILYRAARSAHQDGSQLVGLFVTQPSAPSTDVERANRKSKIEELGGQYYEVFHDDVSSALLTFAESEGITKIFVDPHVKVSSSSRRLSIRQSGISRLRKLLGFTLAVGVLSTLTIILVHNRGDVSVPTSLALYLLAVVGISAVGGSIPGIASAIVAPLLANWYLIAPYHTFRINRGENLLELVVFLSTSLIVSSYVSIAARRATEAHDAWREASTLAALANSESVEALEGILELLCATFKFSGAAIIKKTADEENVVLCIGKLAPTKIDHSDFSSPLSSDTYIAATGPTLSADDYRILHAFLNQLSRALEQQKLREIALEADALSRADELRTAILRAVSHDLRSPLSSIKASVSSLRQSDVEWPEDIRQDFLSSIESETDRLTGIVTNLLDLSRLEAGVLHPVHRNLSLEEIVPSVVLALGERSKRVQAEIPQTLPELDADPALTDRVISNLVENALKWSPVSEVVTIRAHERDNRVQIHVIDRGPGIPPSQRNVVIQPFHRLDDANATGGLGLGLAIADRMVAAMHGTLELRDTPGGGLTAVVSLPCAREEES